MRIRRTVAATTVIAFLLVGSVGCESMPGSNKTQGAVIGGVSGAVLGAAVGGKKNRMLGAILGGAAGAGGGYVIGAQSGKIKNGDKNSANQANQQSQDAPATAADARRASTADINSDGFVTLDEVVAMVNAEFSDDKILDRLEATGQIFELTEDNRQYLKSKGVSWAVIDGMEKLNVQEKNRLLNEDAR